LNITRPLLINLRHVNRKRREGAKSTEEERESGKKGEKSRPFFVHFSATLFNFDPNFLIKFLPLVHQVA
jgi:hypothetical protein